MEIDIHRLLSEALFAVLVAVPVAVCSWTIAKEEIFAWLRGICKKALAWGDRNGRICQALTKIFYMPTCEYCTSFWVTLFYLTYMTPLRMMQKDWRGLMIAEFFVMGAANIYMSIYGRFRVVIAKDKTITESVNERSNNLHGRGVLPAEGDGLG